MKRLIAPMIVFGSIVALGAGMARAGLSPAYKAIYCYPTGSYWTAQIAAYPDYYASKNVYFTNKYGAATKYCN